jgi:hypothetical protein
MHETLASRSKLFGVIMLSKVCGAFNIDIEPIIGLETLVYSISKSSTPS